jgi:excisionase family DNA binding protein
MSNVPLMSGRASASNIEPLAYTVRDVTRLLGVSRSHIYELRSKGIISFVKIGGRTLITRETIDRLLRGDTAFDR